MSILAHTPASAHNLLQDVKRLLTSANASSDIDAILYQSMSAIIAGFAVRMTEAQICDQLGISVGALKLQLSRASTTVIGVQHLQPGDLILELGRESKLLVVETAFGPLAAGGPRCLGIAYPSNKYRYNLWEGTELPNPEHVHVRLVRPRQY